MTRKISPFWALLAGFVVVPLASAFNGGAEFAWGQATGHQFSSSLNWQVSGEFAFVCSVALGVVTLFLIACWNEGYYVLTRILCGAMIGVSALGVHLCHLLLTSDESIELCRFDCALLFLPLVWTMLFPVFALCARSPKTES